MLKKSYKGFVIWLIGFVLMIMLPSFLPIEDVGLIVRIVGNIMTISIAVLMFMIYRTEKVFWITGVSYEEAVEAGAERRRAYALKYVKRFGCIAAGFFLFSVIAQVLGIPYGVDIAVAFTAIVTGALSTIRFRL